MRVTLTTSDDRLGRYLDSDHEREVVRLLGSEEELLGTLSWERLIRLILASAAEATRQESRSFPRAPVALRIAYKARNHEADVSVTRDIGPGGTFIETAKP